jgi:GAF domain-containing protein
MTHTPPVVDEAVAALAEFFVDDGTIGETLLRVAHLARQIADADMVGLTLLMDGKPRTGVFTDSEAPEIDRAQYDSDKGPCLSALRDLQIYTIDSTSDDDRWPEFAREAARRGIRSTLSLPVSARDEPLAALNIYSRRPAAFDADCAIRMTHFARHAAVVLANADVYWDARRLGENLRQALESRATIDYAIGIIMAGGGRTPDEAFQVLVRASQRENRKLRDIAKDIVERASRRDPHEGPVRSHFRDQDNALKGREETLR